MAKAKKTANGNPGGVITTDFWQCSEMSISTSTPLSTFHSALAGPLGPTTLTFAVKRSLEDFHALRLAGASWAQITAAANLCLADHNRPQISLHTLRGIVARHSASSDAVGGVVDVARASYQQWHPAPNPPQSDLQVPKDRETLPNLIQGESTPDQFAMMRAASNLEARVEQLRTI